MRTTGCGGGRAARPAPARPVPRAPSSLRPPPTALQGRCRGDPSPPEALSTQQAEIAAEGHGLSHPGLGDSACQAATSHEDARGHTGLLKAVRSHVTFVGLMQGRGYGGTALATKPRPGGGLPHIPRAAPHTQVPSWPWPQWPARERHLSAHTPSTAPARLGARPGCQGEPPAPVPAPSAGQEDTGRVRGQHPLRGSPTPAVPVTPITRSGL